MSQNREVHFVASFNFNFDANQYFWLRDSLVELWRIGSDGTQQSSDYGFKSHMRCNFQGELL